MKAVADILEVSRSNLAERAAGDRRSRGPYRKAGDPLLVAELRRLVDERPTYGYRRITALLNRQRMANGQSRINPQTRLPSDALAWHALGAAQW